ncbi:hypothetical protein BC832DRAFT_311975 [Gaertneriomyces semiglobifer]|nr:hypothetical protein BC832DRAFT_311975 [Gaertneriomyces semiglobifer]
MIFAESHNFVHRITNTFHPKSIMTVLYDCSKSFSISWFSLACFGAVCCCAAPKLAGVAGGTAHGLCVAALGGSMKGLCTLAAAVDVVGVRVNARDGKPVVDGVAEWEAGWAACNVADRAAKGDRLAAGLWNPDAESKDCNGSWFGGDHTDCG